MRETAPERFISVHSFQWKMQAFNGIGGESGD